jgi:lysophospholipase L1-like esterase
METKVVLSRKKKFVFYVIMFGLLALLFEGGARLYLRMSQGYSGGPLLQYEFDAYKNVRPTPNFVDTRGVQHNSQGFRRSSEVSRTKPAGTFRVFLMGGSTAYGTGGLWPHLQRTYPVLKNSQTIDTYLEHDLTRRFPGTRFEVINAAIPSIWTHHHLIYLNQSILKYKPDMVILVDGFNDFFYYDRGHDQFASYAYTEQKVDGVFVLQPMLILERNRPAMPEIEKRLLEFNLSSYLPNYEDFMRQAVPLVSNLERSTVERYGAMYLDGTNIFDNAQGQIFTDYVHLTPEANQMFATVIANHIQCRIAARLDNTSTPLSGAHQGQSAAAASSPSLQACVR